ncbi:L,D-transpeptidase family protein [Rhodococcus sp. BE178]|uniref:L,D-transpeptidase family protein n=1 Tax=Rhodococcus sp. BE178 TaxID=2817737 RepID=UPI003D21C16D
MAEIRRGRWHRLWTNGLMVLIALAFGLVGAPRAGAAVDSVIFAGTSNQVITVFAPTPEATVAELTAWERGADGVWHEVAGPVVAQVGAEGIGAASEFSARTPAGVFPLTGAFGRLPDPGTAMPYFRTDVQDWWDSNPASPGYNTHVRQSVSPGAASENLYAAGAEYDYAAVIGYNSARTPGAGSAIFLHVTDGAPTAGCVAIDRDSLASILGRLDPARHPLIAIGVGEAPRP